MVLPAEPRYSGAENARLRNQAPVEDIMDPQETLFRFQYAIFTVDARLTADELEVKMGIRHILVPIKRLKHVYVDDRKTRESVELIISYVNAKGKVARARIFPIIRSPDFWP